jgi:hypothetical protein
MAPPDDPLYGLPPPTDTSRVYLGNLAIQGERGFLRVPENWLPRLRFNPFYSYLEERAVGWIRAIEPWNSPRNRVFFMTARSCLS